MRKVASLFLLFTRSREDTRSAKSMRGDTQVSLLLFDMSCYYWLSSSNARVEQQAQKVASLSLLFTRTRPDTRIAKRRKEHREAEHKAHRCSLACFHCPSFAARRSFTEAQRKTALAYTTAMQRKTYIGIDKEKRDESM